MGVWCEEGREKFQSVGEIFKINTKDQIQDETILAVQRKNSVCFRSSLPAAEVLERIMLVVSKWFSNNNFILLILKTNLKYKTQ